MKTINFKKIGMENFCCYASPLELDIENGKLIVISGANGVGKTTIFDSISFTLYGTTSKGLKAKDVVNNKIKKNCQYKRGHQEVVREVEKLLVPRTIFMNSLFFGQKTSTFFTDLNDTERKDIFRKILKLDELVIFHKKSSKMIDELDKSIKENENNTYVKKSLLKDCHDQIDLLVREKEEFDINQKKILDSHKYNYDKINLEIEKLDKIIMEYLQEYNQEISCSLGESITKDNYQLKELEINFKNIIEQTQSSLQNKKLELINRANDEKSKELEKINKSINNLKDKYYEEQQIIQKKISKLEIEKLLAETTISNNKSDNSRLNREKQKIVENVIEKDISICPTCNREIDKSTKSDLENYIKELENNIIMLYNDTKNQETTIKLIEKKQQQLKNNMIKMKNEFENSIKNTNNSDNIKNIDQRLKNVITQLKEMGIQIVQEKTKDIKNQKEEILKSLEETIKEKNIIDLGLEKENRLENELSNLKYQREKLEELIKQTDENKYNKERLFLYKNKYKNLKDEIKIYESDNIKVKRRLLLFQFWKEAFSKSGIESMLIDESIPFMNEQVNEYLEQLSFGRYVMTFDTVKQLGNKTEYRDKINLNVLDNESLASTREQFSAGQTRILDIAIILTLCDLQSMIQGIKFNIILMDEIFDSLDDDNIVRTAKLLRSLTRDKSVYIITHRHIESIDADEELKL